VHAGGEDMQVLSYLCHINPTLFTNIFDSQIACAFLDLGSNISYGNLVKLLLNIELNKDQTTTNWLARPLTDKQINYALDDVYYLYKVYLILKNKLTTIKYNWTQEESLNKNISFYINEQHNYINIKNAWKLNNLQLFVLRNLYLMRERLAKNKNKPRSWLITNDDLFILAFNIPTKLHQLNKLNILHNIKPYINNILVTINNTINQYNNYDKNNKLNINLPIILKPLNKEQNIKYKILKDKIKQLANNHQIDYNLLINKDILKEFIITNKIPKTLTGFKYELLSDFLLNEIN